MVFKVKTGLNETLDVFMWDGKMNALRGQTVLQQRCEKKTKKNLTCSSFVGLIHPGKLVFRCRGDMASGPNVHCNLMLQSSSSLPSHRGSLRFSAGAPLGPTFHQHHTVSFVL